MAALQKLLPRRCDANISLYASGDYEVSQKNLIQCLQGLLPDKPRMHLQIATWILKARNRPKGSESFQMPRVDIS